MSAVSMHVTAPEKKGSKEGLPGKKRSGLNTEKQSGIRARGGLGVGLKVQHPKCSFLLHF